MLQGRKDMVTTKAIHTLSCLCSYFNVTQTIFYTVYYPIVSLKPLTEGRGRGKCYLYVS